MDNRRWQERTFESLEMAWITALIVLCGAWFGVEFIKEPALRSSLDDYLDLLDRCCAWDGQWYCSIVNHGYSYVPNKQCNSVFFPALPTLAYLVKTFFQCRTEVALLLVSNVFTCLTVVTFREYVALRFPFKGRRFHWLSALILCVFPTTFFLRMGYSESLFLFPCILAFYLMEKKASLFFVAGVAGAATAARPVGVALFLPVVFYLWHHSTSLPRFVLHFLWVAPLALWGILGFIVFQWLMLGEPFAFIKAQAGWEFREVPPFWSKLLELVTLRPIWGTYFCPDEVYYWKKAFPASIPFLNFQFLSPLYWLLALFCVIVGYKKKIVSMPELVLSMGLLLIPYYIQGPRGGMTSCGRYASVVFPMYFVAASWIGSLRWRNSPLLLGMSTILLFLYSAMFARWYWFF